MSFANIAGPIEVPLGLGECWCGPKNNVWVLQGVHWCPLAHTVVRSVHQWWCRLLLWFYSQSDGYIYICYADLEISPDLSFIEGANTRGNNCKLQNHFFHYAHIVNIWKSLPNSVVDACTVNAFKACLDKFWQQQVVKFYFTADLTRTRNWSEEVIKWYCLFMNSIY